MQSLASELERRSYEIHNILKRKPSCSFCRFRIKYRHMTRNKSTRQYQHSVQPTWSSFNRLFRL